jgi:hypothetical protein
MKLRYLLLVIGVFCGCAVKPLETPELLTKAAVSQDPGNLAASYLGMCNKTWPCEQSLSVFKNSPVMRFGWLHKTFGDQCSCVNRALTDPKPKEFRVHAANGTCFPERGRRCGSYEPFAGESIASADKKLREKNDALLGKLQRSFADLAEKLKAAKAPYRCWASPVLESPFSNAARQVTLDLALRYFPQCAIVDNPIPPQRCIPGYVCEKHGDKPALKAPCIADLDGIDMAKIDIPAYAARYRYCDLNNLWGGKMNVLDDHKPGFIDPRERVSTANQHYWAFVGQYFEPGGAVKPPQSPFDKKDLKGCGKVEEFSDGAGGRLWKQSDAHPGVVVVWDKRSAKPRTLVVKKGGKVVATFNAAGSFAGDGRPMFRTSKAANDFSTSVVLHADGGKRCYKLPQPRFRTE